MGNNPLIPGLIPRNIFKYVILFKYLYGIQIFLSLSLSLSLSREFREGFSVYLT